VDKWLVLGPLGRIHDPFPTIDERKPWATIPATLDAILMGQFATGRVDPLLIAETAEEMPCYLDFAEPRFWVTSDRMSSASVMPESSPSFFRTIAAAYLAGKAALKQLLANLNT
jgi:hypothetical protein